ncbi:hypothetical protein niasHS_017642 [Heterodera schachtii]|uniref:EIF-4F 25 kDa subunit n=1 Tax=Heterodera schachtii TaxID=97005 RepID=A0ABD2I944_HETSC
MAVDDSNSVDQQKESNTLSIRTDKLLSVPFNGEETSENTSQQQQQQTPVALPTSSSKILSKQHPLKTKWNFWFLNNKKKDMDWLERLSKVCTVSTVEEFWAFFDNIHPPSGMYGCDYNFFRDGIEPLWEVAQNKDGGRLVIQVDKQRNELLDGWWMEFLLACIGEQFGDDSDQVCGAVCNIRNKGSKISIWTTNASEEDKNRRIGHVLKDRLQASGGLKPIKINFEDHEVVQQKTSSAIPCRFMI